MIRAVIHFLGMILLAAGAVMAVIDGTRSIADDTLLLTPLEEAWRTIHAGSLEALRTLAEARLGAGVWESVAAPLLSWPAAGVLTALAMLVLVLSKPKPDLFA